MVAKSCTIKRMVERLYVVDFSMEHGHFPCFVTVYQRVYHVAKYCINPSPIDLWFLQFWMVSHGCKSHIYHIYLHIVGRKPISCFFKYKSYLPYLYMNYLSGYLFGYPTPLFMGHHGFYKRG